MAELIVHRIVWKEDSPYGTYLTDDDVSIYWDDSTEALVVRVNGSIETSGDDIPFFFTYAGEDQDFYKTEEHYYTLVCSLALEKVDTSRAISAFPYLSIIKFADHPSCAASPVVCDMSFGAIPTVVNATDATTADGSITVSATSSNGAIEYNIGSDFVYGGGQASGLFEDLLPGNYTIYARDEINCFAEITVNVGINYVYGTLLQIEYFDFVGNQSKVEVLEKSYSGSVTEVEGVDYSCYNYVLRGEGEDDKFKPIISTESQLNLMSITDFQFIDLFTGDPDKYRIRFSKDLGSGYEVKMLHKFLPNQYSETYKTPPYAASFVATDGTATLKDIPFADANGTRLFGSYSQISLIAFCFKKLGLDLGFRCAVNMYATGMDQTDSDDPFEQAYVNVDRYYLENNQPTCDYVVRAILEPYGAQLIQWDGVWNILRVEERVAAFDYREFDSDGNYDSNSDYSPVKDVGNIEDDPNIFTWVADPSLQLMPGYGKIQVNYNLGLESNILINGDFRLKRIFLPYLGQNTVVANIDGFQVIHNDENVDAISYEIINANNIALKIYAQTGLYILSKDYELKMSFSDKIKFKVSYKLSPVSRDYHYQKIKTEVKYGSYYLKSDGFWTTSQNTLVYYAKDFGKYSDFEIIAGQPELGALAGFSIYAKVFSSYVLDAEFTTLANLRDKTTTTLSLATRTELLPSSSGSGVSTDFIYYYELENDTSAESVPDIVRPTDYNAVTNPVQWILKKKITSSTNGIDANFYIDRIAIEYLPEGKEASKTFNAQIDAEPFNPEILSKELLHGSLTNDIESQVVFGIGLFDNPSTFDTVTTGTENADKIYTGYLKDVLGTGFTKWSRDNVSESRLLHDIYLRTVSSQYSRPWRKIFGTLVSRGNYLFPIDTIKETSDSDRLYYPISLTVDDKRNQFTGEFVELLDVSDESEGGSGGGGSGGSGLGFTIGFTVGFDS